MKKTIYEKLEDNTFYSPDGCWYWTGSVTVGGEGYGQIQHKGVFGAHRITYTLYKGPITDDLHVLHTCDNRRCINPDHLYLGTHKRNMLDLSIRLKIHGIKNGRAKLTEDQVSDIRTSGKKAVDMAKLYNISKSSVSLIRSRKNWNHI